LIGATRPGDSSDDMLLGRKKVLSKMLTHLTASLLSITLGRVKLWSWLFTLTMVVLWMRLVKPISTFFAYPVGTADIVVNDS
jgi:hypothetical protein